MKKQTYSRQELRDKFAEEIRYYREKRDLCRGRKNPLVSDYGFLLDYLSLERKQEKAKEAIAQFRALREIADTLGLYNK